MCDTLFAGIRPIPSIPSQTRSLPSIPLLTADASIPAEKPSVDPSRRSIQGALRSVRETIRRSLPKSPTGRAAPSVDPIASQLRSVPPNCRCVDPCRETIRRSVPSVDTGHIDARRGSRPVFTSIPFRECRCAHACRPRMRLRFPKMMSRSFQPRNVALRSNVRHAFRGNPSDSFDSVPDSIPAVDPPPNCRCADPSEKPSVDPSRRSIQGALRCVRETIRRSLPKSPTGRAAPSVDPIASQLRSVPPNCRCADPCRETIRRSVPSVDTGHIDARRGSRPVFTSIPFRECRCAHACRPRMRLRFPKMMSRSFQPRNVALRSNVRHAFRGNPSDSFDSVPDSIPAVDPPPNCRCADPVRETIRRSLPKSPTGRAAPSVDPIASQLRSVPPNCRCADPVRETIRSRPSLTRSRPSISVPFNSRCRLRKRIAFDVTSHIVTSLLAIETHLFSE